jgi:hypothetical protein
VAFFYRNFSPAIGAGSLYVRLHMRVPADSPAPPWNVFFEFTEVNDGAGRIKLVQTPNDAVRLEIPAANGFPISPANALKRDVWQCHELLLDLATGSDGRVEWRLDGQSMAVVANAPNVPAAGFGRLNLGVISDPGTAGVHLYLDDVVVSTTQLGCR